MEKREKPQGGRMPEALQLPDDLQRGRILLSMHGQEHLWIENFLGLSSYSSEEVRVLIRGGWVKICGSRLEILTYTKEEIEITGCICSVCFISAGKKEGPYGISGFSCGVCADSGQRRRL